MRWKVPRLGEFELPLFRNKYTWLALLLGRGGLDLGGL